MARFKFKSIKLRPPPKVPVRERVDLKVKPKPLVEGKKIKGGRITGETLIRRPPVAPSKIANVSKSADLDAKAKSRQRYRNRAGVVMESCLDNLAQLDDLATMHTVTYPNGTVREIPAFTLTAAGEPLGTSGATITRWVKRGMIPEPVLETSRGKVYHIEEVRSFIEIIGKHQLEFRQYRDDHDELKDQIFDANAGIRKGLFPPK